MSGCSVRVVSIIAGTRSTPVTVAPVSAIIAVTCPPQPTSAPVARRVRRVEKIVGIGDVSARCAPRRLAPTVSCRLLDIPDGVGINAVHVVSFRHGQDVNRTWLGGRESIGLPRPHPSTASGRRYDRRRRSAGAPPEEGDGCAAGNLQLSMLALSTWTPIPSDHPLRTSASPTGRWPSIARLRPQRRRRPPLHPERLLKAGLLIALFTRWERAGSSARSWSTTSCTAGSWTWACSIRLCIAASTFAKNRERLLRDEVAQQFFDEVVFQAGRLMRDLGSAFHGGRDPQRGSSLKSFRPRAVFKPTAARLASVEGEPNGTT